MTRKRYKSYLYPGSREAIPPATHFRNKKKLPTHINIHDNDRSMNFDVENDVEHRFERCSESERNLQGESHILSAYDTGTQLAQEIHHIETETDVAEEMSFSFESANYVDEFYHDMNGVRDEENDETENWTDFSCLGDFLKSPRFKEPLNITVQKSTGEITLMILKFIIVHSLSLTAKTDLFQLINCIFPVAVLPTSRYLIDKLFFRKHGMKVFGSCAACAGSLGEVDGSSKIMKCTICKTQNNVVDYTFKNYFISMDVATPICNLLQLHSNYYTYVTKHRPRNTNILSDVYDGDEYYKFVSSLNNDDRNGYVTVTFNTDGAPVFKSSTFSIWPIFLMINELPHPVRIKELILAGLWFGKDKPSMGTFLQPFVTQMKHLSNVGLQCVIEGTDMCIKVYTLISSLDAVARAPVHGFKQFNGNYGCNKCLHKGEWVCNPNKQHSGSMKYPVLMNMPEDRTVSGTIQLMKEAMSSGKAVYGVKCPSPLINLPHYDIINDCLVESMHCTSGIAKQFATIWFGCKGKAGLICKSYIQDIDNIINDIRAPHQVGRLTRPFSQKEFWKAREWESWILFYSMFVLQNILQNEYLKQWGLFVEAIYILSKDCMHVSELDRSEQLLNEFVTKTEILYSKVAMTFNVHSLTHITKCVRMWGPLWCHNAYGFESGNGDLLNTIHAAKGIHNQIARQISIKYSFLELMNSVSCKSIVKKYCGEIGGIRVKNSLQSKVGRYFGKASEVHPQWLQRLQLTERAVAFEKIVIDRCLFTSTVKRNKRSDNSYIQLKCGVYARALAFIIDPELENEYTIIQKLEISPHFNSNYIQKIIGTSDEEVPVPTENIFKICVHKTGQNDHGYVCALPNSYQY